MSENKKPKRQFIAGAVCPACKKIDKTVVVRFETGMQRECIACGRSEQLDQLARPAVLATRVNRGEKKDNVTAVDSVRLIDPKK